jgi:DNA gyrase/topoisomerase IV subunit A
VPLLLVNGCFGIAIGSRIESPKHSLNDVIDATIDVLHNPKAKVVLIPDPCQKCEVIDTDWKKISNTGYGYYIERGIIDIEHNNKTGIDTLHIRSTPDLIFYDSIDEKIENLIDFFQENLPKITNFIIYGENELSAICHVCRAICRRAEREIITVNQQYTIDNNVITYINRLSDFLFVLARVYTKNEEKSDFLWKK